MKNVGNRMNGLALHYYTVPTGNWRKKGPAINFDEDQWISTLQRTLRMEELITKHSAVMDRHDPEKRIALVVDEWGTWYDVEAGTNPGFLYQQNTLRDALVAALNLHIFHAHADRVTMANIAQIINVLQSVILTDKEKMIVTPTYHVFEMFNVHQDATLLPVTLVSPDYVRGQIRIPAVGASASRAKSGRIHLSLANCDPQKPATIATTLTGVPARSASGRILTAPAMNTHNTFAHPDAIKPAPFAGAKFSGSTLTVELPPKSVVILELN